MVAAGKNPSPPGPEEAAAGEAVAAHIIILAAALSPRAGQADTRAHTQPFSNDDQSGGGLSLPQQGDYKDSDLLLLLPARIPEYLKQIDIGIISIITLLFSEVPQILPKFPPG